MNRKALGKGLSALIPDFELGVPEGEENAQPPAAQAGLTELLIEEIVPNPYQPRKHFDDEKLEELVESIRANGIIQPVVVQKGEKGYELIVGERRWRASQKVGLKKIPAIVRETSSAESLALALIENLHRHDLNPLEEAEAYQQLIDEFDLTQQEVAKSVGKSRTAVTNTIRLLKLPRQLKTDVIEGRLTMGHARALLSLPTEGERLRLREEIVRNDLNVRQTEKRIQSWSPEPGKSPSNKKAQKDIFIKDLEKEFGRILGTKIDIVPAKKGGKLVIHYYSEDDLERIRELIQSKTK